MHSQKRNIMASMNNWNQTHAEKKQTKKSIWSLKTSWGASASNLELLAVQWLSSNLSKVGSYVAIGGIQSKVAVSNHP